VISKIAKQLEDFVWCRSGHTRRGAVGQETGRIRAVLLRLGVRTAPAVQNVKTNYALCAVRIVQFG